MKRLFLVLLFFSISFHSVFSNISYSHYLNPDWLKGLNSTQKKIVLEELERSTSQIEEQNLTQAQKESKLKEMFGKLKDGFWAYRLSSINQALVDSIDAFNKTTGLNVYVYSYVEDAGFLNNLFKRLSEAKYQVGGLNMKVN